MKDSLRPFHALLLFAILPLALRLGVQLPLALESGALPPILGGLVFGISQDVIIALQGVLLCVLIKIGMDRGFKGASAPLKLTVPAVATALIWGVMHLFYVFDLFLMIFLKTRMSWALFGFVGAADSFADSIQYVGAAPIILTVVGWLIATVAVGVMVYKSPRVIGPRVMSMNRTTGYALAVAVGVCVAGALMVPHTPRYWLNNGLFADQLSGVKSQIANITARNRPRLESLAPLLSPQAERYTRADANYPLLKWTSGFSGERQFDLAVPPEDKPHVIFLFLESFRAHNIGVLGGRPAASPNFDRLSKEGVLFTNAYANGIQTTRAVLATLFGVYPNYAKRAVQSDQWDIPLIGVQDLLKRRGYHTAYHHNGSLKFEKKQLFFPRHGFDNTMGYREILRHRAQRTPPPVPIRDITSWGIHDEHLMEFSANYLADRERAGQPTFLTMFTVSHHHPWRAPRGFTAPRHGAVGGEYRDFLNTYHYTDHALGRFVALLKERGLYDKSIIVVLADTAQPMGEHGNFGLVNHLYEENVRIPLLILAPRWLRRPAVVTEVVSQVDILPTIMDMLSLQGYNHAVGTSLMRKVEGRHALFGNPFSLGHIGVRVGDRKIVHTLSGNTTAVYDLSADAQERRDIAAKSQPIREDAARWAARAVKTAALMRSLYDEQNIAP